MTAATKKRVLIVDDNADLLPLFEHLNDRQIEFLVASNGMDALAIIEEGDGVDAVLMDLAMPTFDGIAAVEEIRRNEKMHPDRKPMRLAFFTSSTVDRVIHRVQIQNNVERVFVKPFDPRTLAASIKGWLNV